MKTKLLALLLVGLNGMLYSQEFSQYCAQDVYISKLSTDSNFLSHKNIFEQNLLAYFSSYHSDAKTILLVPVVFHIIHNGGTENIADARIQSAIDDLNAAFSNRGDYSSSIGVNTEIEFCLAKQTPSGTFSNGINRISSALTSMTMETQDVALKSLSYWNANLYLNIWVVKDISSVSLGSGVAGYAYFPSAHGSAIDGIVVEAPTVGADVQLSKVLIHEAGHYFGLYHTFQSGCGNINCLTDGDLVCDTPPDNTTADLPCSTTSNSCLSDADDLSTNNPFRPISMGGLGDQNDLNTNYMDYGNIVCFTAFTDGQKNRMRYALEHARMSLLSSIACNSLCSSPTTASFTRIDTTLLSGTSINFTNSSIGASSYRWTINGVLFSTLSNPSYPFNSSGTYIITLEASNGDTACTSYFYDTIVVRCAFDISITSSATGGSLNSTINFSTALSGVTVNWFIDGVNVGSGSSINHTFTAVGGYVIYAIADNGICFDTSNAIFVSIGTCNFSKNYDRWHFGSRVGLDFGTGAPIAFAGSACDLFEGDASYGYSNGRTMMYAGLNSVFDSTHTIMPNSAGLLGSTTSSSTQGMLFIKKPASDSIVYVFTTDEEAGARGFRYSEINMKLRGGLGDVTTSKNNLLYTPSCEKVCAIRHCNGKKVWVISHEYNSNRFIVYKIDENGVDTNEIYSAVGSAHAGPSTFSHGQLIASPDGKRIAIACQQGFIEVFDFNNSTGILSNPIRLTESLVYGIAFSPNNRLLYASGISLGTSDILQYNLYAGSTAAIAASRTVVGVAPGGTHGSFQLFKDGKIYHTNGYQTALSVIDNPNILGVGCNYAANSIAITSGRQTSLGLNNIPVTFSSSLKPALAGLDTICSNTMAQYDVLACSDSSYFSIIGTAQILSSDDNSVQLSSTNAGTNKLIVKLMSECGVDFDTFSFFVKPGPTSILPDDTTLCSNRITLFAGTDALSYLWSTGEVSSSIFVSVAGDYWVRKTGSSGCIAYDTTHVYEDTIVPLNLGNDTFICADQLVHLNAGNSYSSYRWQDGLDLPFYSAYHSGLYYLTVRDICNRQFTDTVQIYGTDGNLAILPLDTCIAAGASLCINASNLVSYLWYTNDSTASICISPLDSITTVWIIGKDLHGCTYDDTMQVCVLESNAELPIVPNAFSPNADGLNDFFTLVNLNKFTIDEFSIWNRWGGTVYYSTGNSIGWNGKINTTDQPIGSYVYFIKTRNKLTDKAYQLTGTVSLIR